VEKEGKEISNGLPWGKGEMLTFNNGRTIWTNATDWRSQCPKGDVGRSSTCKDQYETSNQIWFPKGKSQTKTPVFQIEIDGKRYTALSVGRDFTSQGRDNNLRNEKWEGTTHPSPHPIMIDQIDSADPTNQFWNRALIIISVIFFLLFLSLALSVIC
jgi:hypothetical protein